MNSCNRIARFQVQRGKMMFEVNEYFAGQVKSIAFKNGNEPATIGVMAAGDYEFGTSTIEHMTLISGHMSVKLPGESKDPLIKS